MVHGDAAVMGRDLAEIQVGVVIEACGSVEPPRPFGRGTTCGRVPAATVAAMLCATTEAAELEPPCWSARKWAACVGGP